MTRSRDKRKKEIKRAKRELIAKTKSLIKEKHNISISTVEANALIRSADETTKEA